MSPKAMQALAASLGLTAGVGAGAASAGEAGTVGAPLEAPAAGPIAGQSLSGLLQKLLLALGGVGVLAGGAAVVLHTSTRTQGSDGGTPRIEAVSGPSASARAMTTGDVPSAALSSDEPSAPAPTEVPSPPPAKHGVRAPDSARESTPHDVQTTNDIAREVRLIGRARSALASGDLRGADAALDEYERSFSRGSLAQEAAVLRIDRLSRSGDRAATERAVAAYLAAHPKSPHAARLRAMVGAP